MNNAVSSYRSEQLSQYGIWPHLNELRAERKLLGPMPSLFLAQRTIDVPNIVRQKTISKLFPNRQSRPFAAPHNDCFDEEIQLEESRHYQSSFGIFFVCEYLTDALLLKPF